MGDYPEDCALVLFCDASFAGVAAVAGVAGFDGVARFAGIVGVFRHLTSWPRKDSSFVI